MMEVIKDLSSIINITGKKGEDGDYVCEFLCSNQIYKVLFTLLGDPFGVPGWKFQFSTFDGIISVIA